ncbi:hypothetical protein BU198_01195 [Streptomyces sp. CBMA156]|nr:hypothetical protein [Streptomyces sp. CBMA156]
MGYRALLLLIFSESSPNTRSMNSPQRRMVDAEGVNALITQSPQRPTPFPGGRESWQREARPRVHSGREGQPPRGVVGQVEHLVRSGRTSRAGRR